MNFIFCFPLQGSSRIVERNFNISSSLHPRLLLQSLQANSQIKMKTEAHDHLPKKIWFWIGFLYTKTLQFNVTMHQLCHTFSSSKVVFLYEVHQSPLHKRYVHNFVEIFIFKYRLFCAFMRQTGTIWSLEDRFARNDSWDHDLVTTFCSKMTSNSFTKRTHNSSEEMKKRGSVWRLRLHLSLIGCKIYVNVYVSVWCISKYHYAQLQYWAHAVFAFP